MNLSFIFLSFFFPPQTVDTVTPISDTERIIVETLKDKNIQITLNHYFLRGDSVFIKLPAQLAHSQNIYRIIYKDSSGNNRTIYSTLKSSSSKPIIDITTLSIMNDSAKVVLGITIEGIVGNFTLSKKTCWTITKADVYQI